MADLKITELAALAGIDLAAGDLLAIADISGSETKKITVTDFLGNASTLIADATIPGAKILFGAATIPGSALQAGAVTATQLGAGAVTAAKLGNESTVDLVTTLPVSGAFTGQFALDTDDSKAYLWDGSQWVSFKAAGSVNAVVGSTAGIVNVAIATSGDTVTITTSLDDTTGAAEFLAGPTGTSGAVGYRAIVGTDLPEATTTTKGAIIVDSEGLRMDGDNIEIDNDVVSSATHHVVTYDDKGLITAGRGIVAGDLPAATISAVGGIIVGTGLSVDGTGLVNHANNVVSGTSAKVTFDSEGHVTGTLNLEAADIPSLDTAKIATGTFGTDRIADSAITGPKLANYAVSKFGETQPTADHIGQFFFNPLSRDLFLWDGNVFQPIGISIGEIVFAGTFDAGAGGGTGLVASVTADGTAVGLIAGQALPAAATANNRYYLVVSEPGTITSGNAPNVALSPPDIVLSNGNAWTEIDVSQTITAQVASNVSFTPAGDISASNVQAAIQELDTEKLPLAGGTITGELLIGTAGSIAFEGSSANDFETFIAIVDPTADRTITFPDATGTVVLSGAIVNADINASAAIAFSKLASLSSANILVGNGSNVAASVAVTGDVTITNAGVTAIAAGAIVNADVSASAEIAVSKLADGAARQLLQTDAAGTGVEWTSNVDVPGALDVTGAATFDSTATVTGLISANGKVSFPLGTDALPSLYPGTDTNTGIYSPGADQLAISTNGTGRLFVDSSGNVGIGTAAGAGTRLSVTSSTSATSASLSNSTTATELQINGSTLYVSNYNASGAIAFRPGGGTETVRFTDSGRVGIGTSSPADMLSIVKVDTSNSLFDSDAAITITNPNSDVFGRSTNLNFNQGTDIVTGRIASISSVYTNFTSSVGGALAFSTNNGSGTVAERLRITSAGLVGIGTSTVQAGHTLQVNGPVATVSSFGSFTALQAANGIGFRWALANDGTFRLQRTVDGFATVVGTPIYIDDLNRVGIGTTSPSQPLQVNGNVLIGATPAAQYSNLTVVGDSGIQAASPRLNLVNAAGSTRFAYLYHAGTGGDLYLLNQENGALQLGTNNAEQARIDSSGRLLLGTSDGSGGVSKLVVQGASNGSAVGVAQISYNGSASAALAADTDIGYLRFTDQGSNSGVFAQITATTDATTGASDYPGRLVLSTTASGAASPTERMRISQNGVVTIKNGAVAEIGTLTDGATITPNFSANCNFTVTLGGNRTLANPTNQVAGQSGSIFVVQDGTGSRTLAYGVDWEFAGGSALTLSTAANAVDRIDYIVRASGSIHAVLTKALS